ncbi:hypothetical protein [Burkholderia seminalis]|uniref:hypothetical protein n=1 Tax=Burkholderia seminalis TaxID=488731 RepID=UPI001454AA1B|nr:hypothetical protein [Burkholderia seminalis]MCA8430065.1 hypothetical protein [Burkholderia seminalis]VWB16555.1 hypothetical protein BSE24067_00598 [Burkholderia seminalis]
MDVSFINAAAASLGIARDFGKAALAVRDFNEMAAIVSKLNDQILDAQDKLFALQRELFREQQEHFEAEKKIVELEKALKDQTDCELVDIGKGFRAYQDKDRAVPAGEVSPVAPNALHFFCQPCFESTGIKSTLQPDIYMGQQTGWKCRICKEEFASGSPDPAAMQAAIRRRVQRLP